MDVVVNSPQETIKLGISLAQLLHPGDIISLHGELGAGKTQFVKGIGIGLDIASEYITSPTFTLINQYEGRLTLYHFDAYRLSTQEFEGLGYEEYFFGDGICVVEWGNKVDMFMPRNYLTIVFKVIDNSQMRQVMFRPQGVRFQQLVNRLKAVIE